MLRLRLKPSLQRGALALTITLAGIGLHIPSGYAAQPIGVTAALRGDVVRLASFESNAAIGQMSSGQQVFLGDDIKVGGNGRLQLMLLDETIFTLGANAVMRIDEFVFDPSAPSNNTLTTSIAQGAFRFVSGQVARRSDDAMTVKLPSATIGVRGTSVAGEVSANGAAQVILLGPAIDNNLGLPAGAINVANTAGGVDITRPGFVTQIAGAAIPPEPPQQATTQQIRQLEQALSEDAVSELAAGLGVNSSAIVAQEGQDSDGDGQLDSYVANEQLSKAILQSTGSDGGVTNDRDLLQQVAVTLFGNQALADAANNGGDFFQGINLGEDIGNLLSGDFDYLGPTLISDLADFGPTGRVTFTGTGATIEDTNGRNSGTFNLTQIWDYATQNVSSTISGNFDIAVADAFITGTLLDNTQTLSFANASGAATVNFSTSFSADPQTSAMSDAHVFAQIGGSDSVQPSHFREVGAPVDPNNPSSEAAGISAFAALDSASEQVFIDNTSSSHAFQMQINVSSFLSNVDRHDGASSTASIGEGSVALDVFSYDMPDANGPSEPVEMVPSASARGAIFAMKRVVEE